MFISKKKPFKMATTPYEDIDTISKYTISVDYKNKFSIEKGYIILFQRKKKGLIYECVYIYKDWDIGYHISWSVFVWTFSSLLNGKEYYKAMR